MSVRQYTLTDKETGRTFNLHIEDGNKLIQLQELNKQDFPPHWDDLSPDFPDGLSWWEQWENEVKAGAFT